MVVLKRVRAATLLETIVATIIISVSVTIALLSINNIILADIKSNKEFFYNTVDEASYFSQYGKQINEVYKKWYEITTYQTEKGVYLEFKNLNSGKKEDSLIIQNDYEEE